MEIVGRFYQVLVGAENVKYMSGVAVTNSDSWHNSNYFRQLAQCKS